jgi:hypothetical protein
VVGGCDKTRPSKLCYCMHQRDRPLSFVPASPRTQIQRRDRLSDSARAESAGPARSRADGGRRLARRGPSPSRRGVGGRGRRWVSASVASQPASSYPASVSPPLSLFVSGWSPVALQHMLVGISSTRCSPPRPCISARSSVAAVGGWGTPGSSAAWRTHHAREQNVRSPRRRIHHEFPASIPCASHGLLINAGRLAPTN